MHITMPMVLFKNMDCALAAQKAKVEETKPTAKATAKSKAKAKVGPKAKAKA